MRNAEATWRFIDILFHIFCFGVVLPVTGKGIGIFADIYTPSAYGELCTNLSFLCVM